MQNGSIDDLVDEYSSYIYSLALKLTSNKSDADDLYQDTFLVAFEKRHAIKRDHNIKAFLAGICIKLWRNEYKKRGRRNRIASTICDGDLYLEASSEVNILNEVIQIETKDMINKYIASLNDKHKIPLILYFQMELSIGEISKVLKIPKGTVKSRLFTAKKKIKGLLEVNGYKEL